MNKLSFLDQEPPPGYIAGIGRGATGFVTQADLGTGRKLPIVTFESKSTNADHNEAQDEDFNTEPGQFEDAQFDLKPAFSGADKEDQEADAIYDEVEKYLEKKRKKKNKGQNPKTASDSGVVTKIESTDKSILSIAEQFEDVKEGLASVSKEEWENLPESGDFTRRNKRLRTELQEQQRFYRNSDMIALSLKESGATDFALDEVNEQVENNIEGTKVESDGSGKNDVNLLEVSRTKDRLLEYQIKLGNQKVSAEVDKNEYLEDLKPASKYNIGDYKKTRRLFTKLRETNPYSPQNWIASARLEYDAQKISRAKFLIQEGCERCPKSEEIWLTNLEFNSNDLQACKVIVADAIKYNFRSLKLWLKAVELENDNLSKVRILRKALELQPKVSTLWLEIIKYEEDKKVSIKMLQKATELIPDSLELWTALAELQDVNDSILTLTNSVKFLPKETRYQVWIIIAKLEEERSLNEVKIDKFISKGFDLLDGSANFEEWFKQAKICEEEKHILTCRSIIFKLLSAITDINIDSLISLAKVERINDNKEISSSILFFITSNYPDNINSWLELLKLKKETFEYRELSLTYEMAISALPRNADLYLMYAEDRMKLDHDEEKIRSILADALEKLPQDERIWTYTIKFETKFGGTTIVRELFENCLNTLSDPSVQIWLDRIDFECKLDNFEVALEISTTALLRYPDESLLYLQKGKIYESINDFEKARMVYNTGIKMCKNNETLYIHLAHLYETKLKNVIKSRSLLDEALTKHTASDCLHHSRIFLELRTGNKNHAERLLSKALNLVPSSAILWRDNIELAPKQQAKNIYAMALKKTNEAPLVILTIAKDLWKKGKVEKANKFFKACIERDALYGDAYIYFYAFLLKFGSKEEMKDLEKELSQKFELLYGVYWADLIKENEKKRLSHIQLVREAAFTLSKSM